jgi:cell division protein FtsI (penicillin-binding protein 3)
VSSRRRIEPAPATRREQPIAKLPLSQRPGSVNRRIFITGAVTGSCLVAVAVKVGRVQLTESSQLQAVASEDRRTVTQQMPPRGAIFDRNGDHLALSIDRYSLVADPEWLRRTMDAGAAASVIGPIVGVDVAELAAKLEADTRYTRVKRLLDDSQADALIAAFPDVLDRWPESGLRLVVEQERQSPAWPAARSVLGDLDPDGNGATGLEMQWNEALAGIPGETVRGTDRDGNTIPFEEIVRTPAVPGDDLVLTIDRSLQFLAERRLAQACRDFGSKGAMAIVMDPRTGDIVAMANVNRDPETDEVSVSGVNNALLDTYEPGSTNKVITLGGAIEEGLVNTETSMLVPYSIEVSDKEFKDQSPRGDEVMTVRDILVKSSNPGTIMIAEILGSPRLERYLRAFGFGRRTTLQFKDEARGILTSVDRWQGSDHGAIPIGQGIGVTAMQMLDVFATIANGGMFQQPRLVSARIGPDGVRRDLPLMAPERVISEETAAALASMLTGVVDDERGTGSRAAVPGYSVAGKTGTARKPQPQGGYALEGTEDWENPAYAYVSSFAGFVPAEDPQLAIIVVMDEPTSSIFGGTVAAPVFADLAQEALAQLRIPPPEGGPAPVVGSTEDDPPEESDESGPRDADVPVGAISGTVPTTTPAVQGATPTTAAAAGE